MKSRVINTFFRLILALVMAPVILLGWIMICIGERKEFSKTTKKTKDLQFYVCPDLDTVEIEEYNN